MTDNELLALSPWWTLEELKRLTPEELEVLIARKAAESNALEGDDV